MSISLCREEREFVKGQILVCFKKPYCKNFVREFGKTLGYNLSEEEYRYGSLYIFQTEIGKEEETRKGFEFYSKFVDWTSLRDLKIERRWGELESIIKKFEELSEDVAEISDKDYKQRLNQIIEGIKVQNQ
jgi:hypothetical protein